MAVAPGLRRKPRSGACLRYHSLGRRFREPGRRIRASNVASYRSDSLSRAKSKSPVTGGYCAIQAFFAALARVHRSTKTVGMGLRGDGNEP